MTIPEAIKFIVDRKDNSLLTDSNKFKDYLKGLCSDNPKELKIINRILDDEILAKIFGNERDNVKIARLREEFEDQGLSTDWSEFIISSFAQVLNWNYEPEVSNTKNTNSQPLNQQTSNTSNDFNHYLKLAEQGDPEAQNKIGKLYYNGNGVPQDTEQAFYWFKQAADRGNAKAQNNLGYMYYNGEAVEQDYEQSIKWYRKAAEQGNTEAQFNLGYMYYLSLIHI